MSFRFERMKIWVEAMDLGEEINGLSYKFPDREKFNLSSQITRAIDSVALNISEGSIGQSDAEFSRFLGYSVRSIAEVVTCLYKARNRKYLTEDEFKVNYDRCFSLLNMIIAFRKNLK
ncbi:four helix bundle protein [Roseivirga pacifica]|uniref:Four helix bundle protein n=1 Tax=Roseivirga pacifica TaxID=1267423 RepID=A0A1I0RNP9_9BACT|nr:four helix bundle protein [Roseivirga pacifica]RKQ49946.1 four helix bundle protein [Roseivirga pacifica]SEW42875.1 four helix bundle protein [Roseivirga pacifica]|tara:strand:+ start:77 stop:430 length:354 start_codon:yes stop_codon:yes gene_type:complete